MKRWLANTNMQNKLLISFLVVVLLPLFVIGQYFISKTNETVTSYTNTIHAITNEQISSNVGNLVNDFVRLSEGIRVDRQLIRYLNQTIPEFSSMEEMLLHYQSFSELKEHYFSRLSVAYKWVDLRIYTTNWTIVRDSAFISDLTIDNFEQQQYTTLLGLGDEPWLSGPVLNEDGHHFLLLWNRLRGNEYAHLLKLGIPEAYLFELIRKEGQNKEVYIVNAQEGTVYSSTNRPYVGRSLLTHPIMSRLDLAQAHTVYKDEAGNAYFVYVNEIGQLAVTQAWRAVSIIPANDIVGEIQANVRSIQLMIAGVIAVAVLGMLLLSRKLTHRLKELARNMVQIRDGKFEVFVNAHEQDEIGQLASGFKKMIERINALIQEVYLADLNVKTMEIQKKEAELHALQSQINPHFLFNTLESIRMSLIKKGDHASADIIEEFSSLFRRSIFWESDRLTLRQEIQYIESYIKVQKFRYRDKIHVSIALQEDTLDLIIPKFIIQPIVENAIYHGLERKEGRGIIRISAVREQGWVRIVIEDDGIGITPERLREIRETMENPSMKSSSVGIRNVYQRLKSIYGEAAVLQIESREGEGSRMEIRIHEGEGDDV